LQANHVDVGDWKYDARKSQLVWTIDLVDDTNRTGSAEFVVAAAADPSAFFPIEVGFSASRTLCQLTVDGVVAAEGGDPVKYGARTAMAVDSYVVE
jgi:coatomer subunit delta